MREKQVAKKKPRPIQTIAFFFIAVGRDFPTPSSSQPLTDAGLFFLAEPSPPERQLPMALCCVETKERERRVFFFSSPFRRRFWRNGRREKREIERVFLTLTWKWKDGARVPPSERGKTVGGSLSRYRALNAFEIPFPRLKEKERGDERGGETPGFFFPSTSTRCLLLPEAGKKRGDFPLARVSQSVFLSFLCSL